MPLSIACVHASTFRNERKLHIFPVPERHTLCLSLSAGRYEQESREAEGLSMKQRRAKGLVETGYRSQG
jgi:hypothetical protein